VQNYSLTSVLSKRRFTLYVLTRSYELSNSKVLPGSVAITGMRLRDVKKDSGTAPTHMTSLTAIMPRL